VATPEDSAALPAASRPTGRLPVLCCIGDTSASSKSAIEHAARVACGRRSRGGKGLLAVVIRSSPAFAPLDRALGSDWADGCAVDSGSAAVRAMLDGVSRYFGIAIQVDEVSGWSQAEIARIARQWGSDTVILPMLGNDAGRLRRWRRRSLVSGLVARTRAVVIDEYDRPCAIST
jgi:hypothetical protein